MLRSIGILLLLFLTTFPISAQKPAFVSDECPFDPPEGVVVECGMVTLPEDRANPDGNQVQIAVALFRALSDDPLPDPVFYLAGGPGSYTLETWAPYFNSDFAHFNQRRDVVLFDYRGTGSSLPNLFCDEVYEHNLASLEQRDDESTNGYYAALDVCRQRLTEDENINLHMYRSAILADDVVDLRDALGYEEINLLGVSYGTRLALTLLRDHPEGIRSVILDGVYPPQVDRSAESLLNDNHALEELFTACASTAACHEVFPNLRATFYAAANQLNDKPATIDVAVPSLNETYEVLVDGSAFANEIFIALYSSWIIPSLPAIIDQVSSGNYVQLANLISTSIASDSTFSLGLYIAQECSDETAFNDINDVIKAEDTIPDLAAIFDYEYSSDQPSYFDTCAMWRVPSPDPIENEPVYSEVPILIFNGQFDPVTPPEWGELAAQTLPNSTLITFPGLGHTISHSGSVCAHDIATAFFSDPEAALDTSCSDDATINWVTVDLSNTLADIAALLEVDNQWVVDNQQTSLTWNTALWRYISLDGILSVTDYTTPFSEVLDEAWFDSLFFDWDEYELISECSLDGINLYEFTAQLAPFPDYTVRYWVDRRRPELNREVYLALPELGLSTLDKYSKQLFPDLPSCAR